MEYETLKISYTGGYDSGYEATYGWTIGDDRYSRWDRVQVRKVEGKWEAWYYGNPYSIAHPECRYIEGGSTVQACTCPKVKVPGLYPRRKEAAQAAWAHKLATGEYTSAYEAKEHSPKYTGPKPDLSAALAAL